MTTRAARALAVVAWIAISAACDQAPPPDEPAAATPKPKARENLCKSADPPGYCDAGTTLPSGVGCAYQVSDGLCQLGPDGDSCACVDCAGAARCTDRCVDDGKCALAPDGEDCTCLDCARAVAACSPPSVGCKDDGVCSPETDDCTCADCQSLPACGACVTNGECVPYLEGCGCADCKASCAAHGAAGAAGTAGGGGAGAGGASQSGGAAGNP